MKKSKILIILSIITIIIIGVYNNVKDLKFNDKFELRFNEEQFVKNFLESDDLKVINVEYVERLESPYIVVDVEASDPYYDKPYYALIDHILISLSVIEDPSQKNEPYFEDRKFIDAEFYIVNIKYDYKECSYRINAKTWKEYLGYILGEESDSKRSIFLMDRLDNEVKNSETCY